MEERRCPGCGKELEISPRERNRKLYCDQKCMRWAKRHAGELRPMSRACKICGTDISHRPVIAKYCSHECSQIFHGQRLPSPLPKRRCLLPECSVVFQPRMRGQRCCCEHHGKLMSNRLSRLAGTQKPPPWTPERKARWKRRRELKRAAATGVPVVRTKIGERDGWMCHLCDRTVDQALPWPHPFSASLDHVVPLSKGGLHDPKNVRLAHLRCNSAKGNRVKVQILAS